MSKSISLRPLVLALVAGGMLLTVTDAMADTITAATLSSQDNASVNVGEVNAAAASESFLGSRGVHSLTQKHRFNSGQSIKVLDKQQIAAAGPVGGSAQALAYAPGVNVTGYGNTGSTKTSISVNGISQGWGGFGGSVIDAGNFAGNRYHLRAG